MADEFKIADISALAKRLCAYEVRVWEFSVVYDIGMAAHGSQFYHAPTAKDFGIDAFVALEGEFIPRIIVVPGVASAIA